MGQVQQINRQVTHLKQTTARFLCYAAFFILPLSALATDDGDSIVHPEIATGKQALKTARSSASMVVTADAYATDAANRMLAGGGSAIDAAIAAQLVLNLVEPQSSGIGGGGFLLYWDKSKNKLTNFNGREAAPANVNENFFLLRNKKPMPFFDAVVGGYAVGAPGLLYMLNQAHKLYGVLPWRQLFQPAISLSEKGFKISPRLHASLQALKKSPKGVSNQALLSYFYQANGEPKPAGTVLKNPDLAKTLRRIAQDGIQDFYTGDTGNNIVNAIKRDKNKKGYLSSKDLRNYKSKNEKPLCKTVLEYKFCGPKPPSSGPFTAIEILGLLVKTPGFLGLQYDSVAFYHRFVEASKLAFADRNKYIADPAFVASPVQPLLSKRYLQKRADRIPLLKASNAVRRAGVLEEEVNYVQVKGPELPSTTHLSIVDKAGNIVSMTTSIEHAFGSRIMVDGFLLNNQLTDFSFTPVDVDNRKVANRIEGSKMPRSSMAPMIVFDKQNKPVLVIGSPGGPWIIPYVAKVLAQHLFLNVPLDVAIESPHVTNINSLGTAIEDDAPKQLMNELQSIGHQLKLRPLASGLNAIEIGRDGYLGVADSRREGTAAGL